MADSKASTYWFLSQNATSAPGADQEAKAILGDKAGLVTVPYFPLPPHGEHFDDTEGRFPMKELQQFLQKSDDTGANYWYARVLPENGDVAKAEYLMLYTVGTLKLVREFLTVNQRYLATLKT